MTKIHYTFKVLEEDIRGQHGGYTFYKAVTVHHKAENTSTILQEGSLVITDNSPTPVTVFLIRTTRGHDTNAFSLFITKNPNENSTNPYSNVLLSTVNTIMPNPKAEQDKNKSEAYWGELLAQEAKEKAQHKAEHDHRQQAVHEVLSTRHTHTPHSDVLSQVAQSNNALANALDRLATAIERLNVDHEKDRSVLTEAMRMVQTNSENNLRFIQDIALKVATSTSSR